MIESKLNPSVVILVAAFNDWESVRTLIPLLDVQLSGRYGGVRIYIIDDGSTSFANEDMFSGTSFNAISEVRVVTLRRNLGNQRAVAVGLGCLASEIDFDYLVLMDSDHEDKPEYVPQLIDRAPQETNKVVFAERTQRSEGRWFRMFYAAYKALYGLLTGTPISYGNFCAMP
jgi:glycosyltransferase involved in cell wall biosynthesis